MTSRFALAGLTLLAVPASVLEAPVSIENARIEVRAGITPVDALDRAAREPGTTWIGWSVAAVPRAGDVCCFANGFKRRGCSLAERASSWGTSGEGANRSSDVYVLVEAKGGSADRIELVSSTCHVEGADQKLVWLGPVDAGASLDLLDRLMNRGDEKVSETALVAIAYHRDARADALIERRAFDRSLREEAREQAIFWAGQARGESGFRTIERVLATEPDGDLRQHAVFALSQSSAPQAPDRIKRVAVEDKDPEVRAHAYFSLSQTKSPGAGEWIVSRIDAERDDHVREQAVFALSQLDDGTDWLLRVLRSSRDPELVRRALFWLGQSKDPRALEAIEKILDR